MGVKHVSIIFGLTYDEGAILMISSTSNDTVCSSSEGLLRKQVIAKRKKKDGGVGGGGLRALRAPSLNPPLAYRKLVL